MERFRVILSPQAHDDLIDLYTYVASHDSPTKADKLIARIETTCYTLETFPHRGHYPPELSYLGITEFREIHFKPYRIIYQVVANVVWVHWIVDGRRNTKKLFEERLLRL